MIMTFTYWWSRLPGKFLDKTTGNTVVGGTFNGNTREWYETLIEIIIDVQNTVLRRRGLESMKYVSWRADPVIYPIVMCSVLYKPRGVDTVGMIGKPTDGLICNIPIDQASYLDGTGVMQFMQYEGSDQQEVMAAIQIIDVGPNYRQFTVTE